MATHDTSMQHDATTSRSYRHAAFVARVALGGCLVGLATSFASRELQYAGIADATAFAVVVPVVTLLLAVLFRDARRRGLSLSTAVIAIAAGLAIGSMTSSVRSPVRQIETSSSQPPIRVDIETLRRVG